MKIRQGFVSNSSSSSFIFRGVTLKIDWLFDKLKLGPIEEETRRLEAKKYYAIEKALREKGLECRSNDYYFSDEQTGEILVGKDLGSMADGEVMEIPDGSSDDDEIREGLKEIGMEELKLSTYCQYVSNDNY